MSFFWFWSAMSSLRQFRFQKVKKSVSNGSNGSSTTDGPVAGQSNDNYDVDTDNSQMTIRSDSLGSTGLDADSPVFVKPVN